MPSIIIEQAVTNVDILVEPQITTFVVVLTEMQVPGAKGEKGDKGDTPIAEWTGTSLGFDGGVKVDLKGATGAQGSGVKITPWSAGAYLLNDQVNHFEKDWVANAATLSTDVPGTSSKWVERLSGYKADGVVVGGNLKAVSGDTTLKAIMGEVNKNRSQLIANQKSSLLSPIETKIELTQIVNVVPLTSLRSKSWRFAQKFYNNKLINVITISILRDFTKTFTQPILVKVGKNNEWVYERYISLAELAPYDSLVSTSPIASFDFSFDIPDTEFLINDILKVGYECSGTDKVGFTYKDKIGTGQGQDPYGLYSNTVDFLKNLLAPDTIDTSVGGVPRLGASYKRYNFISNDQLLNENSYRLLKDADRLINRNGRDITNNQLRITPLSISLWTVDNRFDSKTTETWYKWVSNKVLNTISIPLVRPFYSSLQFTQDVLVRVAVNGIFVLNHTITLQEIIDAGLNATIMSTPLADFYIDIPLPIMEIKQGDIIYIGVMCGGTDKNGFMYSANTTGEWGNRYYLRTSNDISAYTNVPSASGATDYTFCVKFGFNDYVQEQIDGTRAGVVSISTRNINTFIGATNTVIDYLIAAKPRAKFAFISHFTEDGFGSYLQQSTKELIQAQQAIADYWGVPLLDLSKKLGWVKRNGKNTLIANVPDEIHPGTDTTLDAIRQYRINCVEFLKQFYQDYAGLKVAWYGTSIPYGHPANNLTTRYPDQAVNELGGVCLNKSWPGSFIRRNKYDGTPLTASFLDIASSRNYQISMLDLIGTADEPDLFIFDFGINDWDADRIDFDFDLRIS